jgi:hypothetical protein
MESILRFDFICIESSINNIGNLEKILIYANSVYKFEARICVQLFSYIIWICEKGSCGKKLT